MKTKLCYIYWSLLFISIISSGVLFIIVAAENGVTLGSDTPSTQKKKEAQEKTVELKTVEDVKLSEQKEETNFDSNHFNKLKEEDRPMKEIRSSFEDVPSDGSQKEEEPNSETGTLFQQHASISDELSETGHAVVFTLVDSASQELHQAAASSLLSSRDTENDTASASTSGPVTVPLPLKSDSSSNDSDVYIVRAEPKQLETPSPPQTQPAAQSQSAAPSHSALPEMSQESIVPDVESTQPTDGMITNDTVQEQPPVNDSLILTSEQQPAQHEDIPSFSEWAQKQLAEAEKKKVENKTGGVVKRGMKLRSKNYASPDCGAKVVGTNPEASSVWAVLSPSRDEYLLNSCNNKIWFIVELCEAIQPKKIELANFELFSSILREFSVSVSDRHPSRDWTQIGQFEGKEVRTVQSFNVEPPSAFVKYIRVEFHSHYGAEHYCPISLFRVYGTSEFEVLDTVEDSQTASSSLEDDEDDFEEGENLEKPRNLFSSARDAVLSIVKRAAEVLVVKREDEMEGGLAYGSNRTYNTVHVPCVTPAYIIVCDNCSDTYFSSVHQLLSCHRKELESVLESEFVRNAVSNSDVCTSRGLDLRGTNSGAPYPLHPRTTLAPRNEKSRYLETMLPIEMTTALCNLLAVSQRRVVLNITYDSVHESNKTVTVGQTDIPVILVDQPSTCSLDSTVPSSVPYDVPPSAPQPGTEPLNTPSSQIKPTKTLTAEDQLSVPVAAQSSNSPQNFTEENQQNDTTVEYVSSATVSQTLKTTTEDQPVAIAESTISAEERILEFPEEAAVTASDTLSSFDSIFNELDEVESDPSSLSASQPATLSPPHAMQKESVLLRLARRIKALERNMSLSGQYLEELSRRYKRQVEDMQRTLAEVIEERRRIEEKDERRSQQMLQLNEQIAALSYTLQSLIEERDSWAIKGSVIGQHGAVILIEVVVFAFILFICRWLPDVEVSRHRFSMGWPKHQVSQQQRAMQRRRSIDGSMAPPACPRNRKRRPSEEALRISGSTHQELLIPDASRKNSRAENRRRRRKKKEQASVVTAGGSDETMSAQPRQSEQRQYVETVPSSNHSEEDFWLMPPPLPPPPLPPIPLHPPQVMIETSATSEEKKERYIVMPVNGNARSLPVPSPPHYLQTALSFRKKRNSSRQSSSELSDSNNSSSKLNTSSSSSVKKAGPFKKMMKKLF